MTYGGLSAPTTMLLGERIRELRQERGWTQMELSARSGVGNNAVNFAVFAGKCLSSGKGVAAVMFWMTHCGLIERR